MGHSIGDILIHIVFSTKYCKPTIPVWVERELHAYLAATCRAVTGDDVYKVGGIHNHIHILCRLPRTIAACKVVKQVKGASSRWMKLRDKRLDGFQWQNGYAVFSFGKNNLMNLIDYVSIQREHHRCMTYKGEMEEYLMDNDIEYDETFWD